MEIMSFGKYKGVPISALPKDYLRWLWQQDWISPELRNAIHEVSKRHIRKKQHEGWIGYYNPITGEGGSKQIR